MLHQRIQKWLMENMKSVSIHNSVSIHLDELLGKELQRSAVTKTAVQAFHILVKTLQELQMPVQPILVIPLISISEKIQRAVPSKAEMIEDQLDFEPPSLCLMDWEIHKYFVVAEEYRCPLPFAFFDILEEHIYVYYREHRYKQGIDNDWEFARGVYIEYYCNDSCSN